MGFLSRLRKKRTAAEPPRAPQGERAYAVGDIHGRLDLLDRMLQLLEEDSRGRGTVPTRIVFLGDYIDRGPQSCGVIERLHDWPIGWADPVFLAGNHEEAFLRVIDGDLGVLASWLRFGGAECLKSYGIDIDPGEIVEAEALVGMIRSAVPPDHVEWLRGLADTHSFGDYLFVHAGIRPGVPLEEQRVEDLRWIREAFLTSTAAHGFVVVHGHTIVDTPYESSNRIALDTGAYRSGRLTAMGFEAGERWLVTARDG